MLRLVLAATLMASAAACATAVAPTKLSLAPTMAGGQDLSGYKSLNPDALLESRLDDSTVVVRTANALSDYGASFAVAATNTGGSALPFGINSITASSGGRPLHVYTAAELDKEVKGNARAFLRSSGPTYDPSNKRDIELASKDANRNERVDSFLGCPAGEGRCQIDSADLGSAIASKRQARESNVAISEEVAQRLSDEMAGVMRTRGNGTIEPGRMGGGSSSSSIPQRARRSTSRSTSPARSTCSAMSRSRPDPA